MKILIAADVSNSFANASASHPSDSEKEEGHWFNLEQLASLVPLAGCDVNLIYVKEELPSYERVLATQADFPQDLGNIIEAQAKPVLAELAKRLEANGAKVKTEIVTGPAAYMIEQAALDEKKELVVVSTGPRPDGQFTFGSTSAHVARHAPCSTLVLRKMATKKHTDSSVLIAIDGSEHCLKAIEAAIKKFNSKIENKKINLIYVANISPMVAAVTPRGFVVAMEENLMMEGEVHLATAKKILSDHGFTNLDIILKTGSPAHEIIKAAEETDADLLVIGAQGKGAIKHFLMGEVANKIVTHASVATLVARA
ncbi:MAG: universal stress protein [Candidatus Melainabacteria bacterium]|nr:universal stress protein [Candidatus Melainabacteria bacterium]